MFTNAFPVSISAHRRAADLSDFGTELDTIEALGVEGVELPTYDMDLVVGGRVRRPMLEALKRALAGRALDVSVHGPLAINFMDAPTRLPRHLDVLAASLEVAAEVGARNYVLHAGLHVPDSAAFDDALARQREWLRRAGDLARAHGILLCVETLFADFDGRRVTITPAQLARELSGIEHENVKACIDFSHAFINLDRVGRREALAAEIAALAPFVRHLHVHDSFGRQDDMWTYAASERMAYGLGDLHLPVGWGAVPWAEIFAACPFPEGAVFNIELAKRYWYAVTECVEATKTLVTQARAGRPASAAE